MSGNRLWKFEVTELFCRNPNRNFSSPGPFTTPSPARHPAPGPACRCARSRSLRHLSPHPPASWCCPADCLFLCLDTAPVFLSPSDPSWGACVRVLFLIVRNFFSTVWAGDSLFPPQLSPLSFIYFILRLSPSPSPAYPPLLFFFFPLIPPSSPFNFTASPAPSPRAPSLTFVLF